jgi:Spy/CpxP family protein refolding chaperone
MKKIAAVILVFASFIFSADAQQTRKIKHSHQHRNKMMMMKELNITASQQQQLKASHESYKKQLLELNKNEGITVKEAKDKKELLRKEQKEKMMSLLTAEQKNKLIELKKDRQTRHTAIAEKKLVKMKSRLNLSDDQMAKIKAAKDADDTKLKAIKENEQLSRSEKKEQLMALKKQHKNSFKDILTPEQISKLEELKKSRIDKTGKK